MKLMYGTIIWFLAPILVLDGSFGVPTRQPVRNGKFMAFTAHDMFSDILDGVQDPIPVAGSINENEKFYRMNDTVPSTTIRPSKVNDTKMAKLPMKTEEKIALYNQNTGKFELITTTSGHFSFPMKPVTEKGVFFYGGQHYQYDKPEEQPHGGNRTEEIKIFWTSVGEAVENSPYFPIQINVPDMLNAMTNFLVNYIPFINRIMNPNHPRLPYQIPNQNKTEQPMDYYYNYDVYQPNDPPLRREFKTSVKLEEKSAKRKNKRKSSKKKNSQKSTAKGIFQRPNFRKTTSAPVEDTKLWHQFGSDTKETFRLKNMPITRKRVRVADREIFNFKNSDISNSPIMILNVPQRPVTHYKVTHQEVIDKDVRPVIQPQPLAPQRQTQAQTQTVVAQRQMQAQPQTAAAQRQIQKQQPQPQKQQPQAKSSKVVKQRRKLKNETKTKRSSKRSGRSEGEFNEETTISQPVS